MKELKVLIKKLESSSQFKKFKKEHPDYYLVHCFKMIEQKGESEWQIGYYSEEKDRMIVFNTKPIKVNPEEEIFKKAGVIKKLDIRKVKTGFERALEIAEDIRKRYYSGEMITKKIIILQHLKKQLWNITLISMSFNIINIKINAETGIILKKSIESIMKLGRKT
jgi:hypothetical protein